MFRTAILTAAVGLALAAPAAASTTLDAGLMGTLTTSQPTPVPGLQTFTLNGNFTSYVASANLPQITGGDLNQYSFTATGTAEAYNDATRTATYGNVMSSISGYGQVVQTFAPTTLTVTFDPTFETASVLGTLTSTGAITPPGFPGPIDFTPANGAVISGLYTSGGISGGGGSFAGSINFSSVAGVPEPTTWAMMLVGFGSLVVALRRRRAQSAMAA